MERRRLLSTYDVTSAGDGVSSGTLRWAILRVDADSQPDTIVFEIPSGGFQTVHLSTPLPAITNSVFIDGTTESAHFDGIPLIQIDGSKLSAGSDGLVITAGNSTVRGLAIVGCPGSAIVLSSQGKDVISGDYLGVDASTNQANPNGTGISIYSSSNIIGVSNAGVGNVISGNSGNGISIQDNGGTADGNEILGNFIGTDPSGSVAMGNGLCGIQVKGASDSQIGFAAGGSGNVVSGNFGPGIELMSGAAQTQIQNSTIGVAADAKTPLANGSDGILLDDAPDTVIGGTELSAANVIGSNHGNGINAEGNSSGLVVQGNFIGTDSSATINLGNGDDGILLGCSTNTIGGTVAGASNTIDYNGVGAPGSGVELADNANQNQILSNSIYLNSNLGINFGGGPTQNHAPGTVGPNNYQNYPTLTLAQSDGTTTTINGALSSIPNTTFLLQFFSSPSKSLSGFGEGKVLIGSLNLPTDAQGNATFSVPLASGTAPGQYISATATDPAGNTSEFSLDAQTQGQIDLRISASATPDPVLAGDQLTYAINVRNQGTVAAQQVMVTDQLPGSVKLVKTAVSQGFIGPTMGRTVQAMLGTIAPGGSATLTIVVQTTAASVGSITDVANVTPGDELATVTTTVKAASDVGVTITASPSPVAAGSELTYNISVSNIGPDDAASTTVTLPLGPGVNFVSATPNVGSAVFNNGQVVVNFGTLTANSNPDSVQIVVKPEVAGSLSATASVSSASADPNSSNNTATVTTLVTPTADEGVAIAASAQPVGTNLPFQYTVTVTNSGPCADSNVKLSDTLPLGVTFKSATSDQPGVTPTITDGVVSMTIATLNSGATATMTILVDPTAPPGSSLTDLASVSGQDPDPNEANNSASLVTAVQGVSDLGIAILSQPSAAYVGQELTYTLAVTNQGPNNEPDTSALCPIPSDAAFVRGNGTQGSPATFNEGLAIVDLGPLASGVTAQVTLVLVPLAAATGQFTSSFSVTGDNLDPVPTNNSTQATVLVTPAADLAVSILAGTRAPANQADWTYTVGVTNLGLSDATGVIVSTPVPPNVNLVSITSGQGQPPIDQGGLISAALGNIPAGQSATLTIVVMPTTTGSISLSASVTGGQYDPNPGNNITSTSVSIAPSVNLGVSLAPQSPTALTGQSWAFIATVENTGPNAATNVVLSLPLNADLVADSYSPSQGTCSMTGTQLMAYLGSLDSGARASVTVVVTASAPGIITQSATVTSAENQLDSARTSATATVNVQESAGVLQFSATNYAVPETAGFAALNVTRIDGTKGPVTVQFQTSALNATPGLDFTPAFGTLSLADGQSSATIIVPVLSDPWDNQDEYLGVVLSSPGGGALVGSQSTATLRIIDVDPNTTPPEISQLSWSGSSRSITSLSLSFTAPLSPAFAMNPANYQLVAPALGNALIALTPHVSNSPVYSVTLVPAMPLPSGVYYHLQVVGTGPTAIRDIAGNLLDGASTGLAGSNYIASFAQGTRLQYFDGSGNAVTLKLTGPGYMEQVLDATGEGVNLNIVGEAPHRTTLSGRVRASAARARKSRARGGTTNLGTITGLGNFGDVRVKLTEPPFFVKQYPFQRKGRGVL
jgi:uncharacterized repeat protein (TIGR01451 family)